MSKFFILSQGRTGTKFLSKLLNSVSETVVHHEPDELDRNILFYSYTGQFDEALNGLLTLRFNQLLEKVPNDFTYGECNSYLRYNGKWLSENLHAKLIYTCRDARSYIKSAYPRALYTNLDKQLTIIPKTGTKYAERWPNMTRFEKICWYWAETNRSLLNDSSGNVLQIERLLSKYDYFDSNINKPIGFNISKTDWRRAVMKPENSSSSFILLKRKIRMTIKGGFGRNLGKSLPEYDMWSTSMKHTFNEICGPLMTELGYENF
jgi:hypothetical protein